MRGVEQRVVRGEKRVAEAHDLCRMLQKYSEGRATPTLFCRNRAHRGRGASPSLRRASRTAGSTPPARAQNGKTAVKMHALPLSMSMNAWDMDWTDSCCIRATASCL